MKHVPNVRLWKVTNKVTGRSIEVYAPNRRFARWNATEAGFNATGGVKIVSVK
jgi:hypothetical protein